MDTCYHRTQHLVLSSSQLHGMYTVIEYLRSNASIVFFLLLLLDVPSTPEDELKKQFLVLMEQSYKITQELNLRLFIRCPDK